MRKVVNLSADVAEGCGAYKTSNDAALMEIVRTANVACGFHGGDAVTMQRMVMLARDAGVSIGAHPGFNDLWGFGRREIRMKPAELEYMIVYQAGALRAIAAYAGLSVTHLKAHGALYNMAVSDADYAMAIGRAIRIVDPEMVYVGLPNSEMERAAQQLGLRFAREGFCDRVYTDDGALAPRSVAGSVLRDVGKACEQALHMVLHGEVVSISGKKIKVEVETLCVHGDEPTAIAVAAQVKKALEDGGVRIVTLPEMIA